jgi:hypothetical protein
MLLHRDAGPLDTAGMPAIERTQHILGHQPHVAMAAAHRHFPKVDERKNKCKQACVHRKGVRATGRRMGSLIPGVGGSNGTLVKPGSQPHLSPWA